MEPHPIYRHIDCLCVIGHGSIGRGTVPLLRRHFTFDKLTIIDPNPVDLPDQYENTEFIQQGLDKDNFKSILSKVFVGKVGFCVNLSVGTSSSEIMQYCQ